MLKRILLWLYVFTILGATLFYSVQLYGLYLRMKYDAVEKVDIAAPPP